MNLKINHYFWLPLTLVFLSFAVLACGYLDFSKKEKSKKNLFEGKIPSSWDGLTDWSESDWLVADAD